MRAMNMLQMLGGVAVAGAVAAGTTAFTTSSIDDSGVSTQFIGGRGSVDVTGAVWDSVTIDIDPAPGMEGHVIGATIHLEDSAGADITTGTVQAAITAGVVAGSAPASGTLFTCTGGTSGNWVCHTSAATKYYTGVTKLEVVV